MWRCTLLNDKSETSCAACGGRNPSISAATNDGVRAADPVRRERLIDDDFDYGFPSGNSASSPLSVMGGGALLGGVIGAAGAYIRGRSLTSGAFEGGVAGAATGAALLIGSPDRTQSRASNRTNNRRRSAFDADNLSRARSAGANGSPAYPVMGSSPPQRSSRQQPRASFRVASVDSPDGFRTTIVTTSGGDGPTRFIRRSQNARRDSFQSLMLHSMMGDIGGRSRVGFGGAGVDNMSYEQLLAAFGDGSENLGASVLSISSLPTAKVATKKDGSIDLPPDACDCSICLENFEEGQIRKTLPCLHGFHSTCVDKWLSTNGACPVCKYRVDERDSS